MTILSGTVLNTSARSKGEQSRKYSTDLTKPPAGRGIAPRTDLDRMLGATDLSHHGARSVPFAIGAFSLV